MTITSALTICLLAAVTFAFERLYAARRAAPGRRAVLRNTAGMLLSVGATWAGALFGGLVGAMGAIPAVGWIVIPALVVLSLVLLFGGIIGGIVFYRRSGPLAHKAYAEAYPLSRSFR